MEAPAFDASRPNMARVCDGLRDGKETYAVDRELCAELKAADAWRDPAPGILANRGIQLRIADNRAFILAAVRRAAQGHIGQFLDLGSGFPDGNPVHETARDVIPGARCCYVDWDPVVLRHNQAFMAGPGLAASAADLTDPDGVLTDPAVLSVIDPGQPACLIFSAVAGFYPAAKFREVTARWIQVMAPGSWLVTSSVRYEDAVLHARVRDLYQDMAPVWNHDPAVFASFFHGLDLVPPGVACTRRWVCGVSGSLPEQAAYMLCAAGVKRLQAEAQAQVAEQSLRP